MKLNKNKYLYIKSPGAVHLDGDGHGSPNSQSSEQLATDVCAITVHI